MNIPSLSTLFKTKKTYTTGLALSGGGSKGFAHIGILKAMEEANLQPNVISGTSAGALAGALYADGYHPEEILELFKKKSFKQFAELTMLQAGLFKPDRFRLFLKKNLRSKKFEDLKIPLKVVATDLTKGKSIVFDKGELIDPILASCAYPIVFTPVQIKEKHYVDGGLLKNFPVSVIRKDSEYVIGVNVNPLTPEDYKNTLMYVAERTFHYVSVANTIPDRRICDILIELKELSNYNMFSMDNMQEIYNIGYQQAKNNFVSDKSSKIVRKMKNK